MGETLPPCHNTDPAKISLPYTTLKFNKMWEILIASLPGFKLLTL